MAYSLLNLPWKNHTKKEYAKGLIKPSFLTGKQIANIETEEQLVEITNALENIEQLEETENASEKNLSCRHTENYIPNKNIEEDLQSTEFWLKNTS